MHMPSFVKPFVVLAAAAFFAPSALAADNPFLGRWALTIPGGGGGWLGVMETNGQLQSSILWRVGSVVPVTTTKVEVDTLIVTRVQESRQKDAEGKTVVKKSTETITV